MESEKIIVRKFNFDELLLKPIGDVHYGTPYCDVELFEKDIECIKSTDNMITIFMGDEMDLSNKLCKNDSVYENISPQRQLEYMVDKLKEVAPKSLGQLDSNHDAWVDKPSGIKIAKIRSNLVGVPFLAWQQTFKIYVNDICYNIVASHGYGGSTSTTSKLERGLKFIRGYDNIDLGLIGHVHDNNHAKEMIKRIEDNTVEYRLRYVVETGSYLKYKGSYAEAHGYSPSLIGTPIIRLSGKEKKIIVE